MGDPMNAASAGSGRNIAATLYVFHDAVTIVSFYVSAAVLAIITSGFCFEVVSRYFFDAPTGWASDLAAYAVCWIIFLAAPELTRRGAHVSIGLLNERSSPRQARILGAIVRTLAGAACLFAAWFSGSATLNQFEQGITTITTYPVPKWWISIAIPYGFLGAGLYFLRQLLGERPSPADPGDESV